MPTFTYKGKDEAGKSVTNSVKVDDRFGVYEQARQLGHTVDSISEQGAFSLQNYVNFEKIEVAISRVKADELVMVTRNLGSMIVAGLPLTRALGVIVRQSKNPRLKHVITDVMESVKKGEAFNEALGRHPKVFNQLYVAMVRAGEESGGLADTLATLSKQMEQSTNLKKRIKGAMIYPAIVITVLVIIGILMMIFVMPSITDTFKDLGNELPPTTKFLIALSDFMVANTRSAG
jgi:type IV pilus assembly protein PilC